MVGRYRAGRWGIDDFGSRRPEFRQVFVTGAAGFLTVHPRPLLPEPDEFAERPSQRRWLS